MQLEEEAGKSTLPSSSAKQQPSLRIRPSTESTATSLPSYREEHPNQPPAYSSAYTSRDTPTQAKVEPSSAIPGPNAAAVRAILAPSSPSTDKMHSHHHHPKRVENWNSDPTYKGKVARLTGGSSRKWNYFGADVGPNPFKSLGRRKK